MAFSFGNSGGGGFNTSNVQELPEIETEALGFHAINGDAKVQLTQAWPDQNLPPPTSSLLAVASKRGLLAAGGPSSVVVATTEAVRDAFKVAGGNNVNQFTPQLTLELGTRISQVAFSSDESVLAISAEQGGGLAVYEVDSLLKGITQTTFEVSTANTSVRALVPNPGSETAEIFAVVLSNGQLVLANMKSRQMGSPIRENATCLAWSRRGKQLIVGLSDGSAVQITPAGEEKKQIPRPPGLEGNQHMSAIEWLHDNTFLTVHTASEVTSAPLTYHIVDRDSSGTCVFKKLPEVCPSFGMERFPASQYLQNLKEFPPHLTDVVIVSSTASEDVGLFTRSAQPLASMDNPAAITNVFTTTTMAIDSRRAALPMSGDSSNSSPVGMVLDLSSNKNVHRPIPTEEMDESSTPLPALLILNNVGVLAGWWFTYAESIRTGTCYPGLVNAPQTQAGTSTANTNASAPSFGQSSLGTTTGGVFGGALKPATSAFGAPSATGGSTSSIFGQSTSMTPAKPAFGAASNLIPAKPAFGAASALGGGGGATFGSPSALGGSGSTGTVFGSTSGIGARASPWGGAAAKPQFGNASAIGAGASPWAAVGSGNATSSTSGSIFGQPSSSSAQPSSFGGSSHTPFGSGGNATSGGFASFASSGGFAAASKGPSIFASQTPSSFGSSSESKTTFGSSPQESTPSFGTKAAPSGSAFGNNTNFSLGSAWKNDKPSEPTTKPQSSGGSLFGNDFGKMLGEASAQPTQAKSEEREMSDEMSDTVAGTESNASPTMVRESTTPAQTPAPAKFFSAPPAGSGLFGTQAQQNPTPALVSTSIPVPPLSSTNTTKIESQTELPLPPDTTSKATFTPATSSAASTESAFKAAPEAAPLPPDFTKFGSKPAASVSSETTETTTPVAPDPKQQSVQPKAATAAPLPPDFLKSKPSQNGAPASVSQTSIFSFKPKTTAPKTPTETSKPFFSSDPDENEFTTTDDDEGKDEDEEADYEDEEEDEEGEEEEEDDDDEQGDDEGSGVDVAEDITTTTSPKVSASSSFARQSSSLTDKSWSNVKIPQQQQSQSKKSIFGEVHFPPKQPDHDRSPSPERRMPHSILRSEGSRSVSAPNIAGRQKPALPRTMKQASKPVVSFEQRREQEQARLVNQAERKRAEEEQSLEDQEDDSIKKLLEAPIEGTTELEPFIAHQDYSELVSKAGVAGQIEKIFRDINSMVDTIGLNCRNIEAFTKGHEEGYKDGRDLSDLSEAKHWTLAEIEDLDNLENGLRKTLEETRIKDVQESLEHIQGLQQSLAKLFDQQRIMRAMVDAQLEHYADEEQHRDLELTPQHQNKRSELRAKMNEFLTKLVEAESAIAMLRTKLTTATANTRHGSPQKVPTMEAVGNTVRKMTSKIEEKRGDIDVLEARMKKLGIQLGSPSASRAGSREGSPFMTPPSGHRHRVSLLGASTNGISPLRNGWRASNNGLKDSVASIASDTSSRLSKPKKVADYTSDDIEPFVRRAERKKLLMGFLRDALVGKDNEKSVQIVQVE